MEVLYLTIKKRWFDMILSGIKKEEYREIKPYWENRLSATNYDVVEFRNGYRSGSPIMVVELKGIRRGPARAEWSDNWKGNVFVLMLGKIIETKQLSVTGKPAGI